MATGSLEKMDGIAGLDIVTVNYFDNRLRVICTVKDNHLGGRNNNFFAYNFSDQVVTEAVVHNASSSPDEIMLITNYTYDHQGRLLEEKLKMNDQPQVTTKAYEYNELGDLVNTYMHGSATGQNFNQNVKNKYNIRGWLRMINNPENLDHDLFGMDLRYESQTNTGTIGVTPKYNGNIAQMRWNSKSDTQRGYGFEYDKLNRLTTAIYGQGANLNSNQDWYKTTYDYDPNGNFTNLTRKKDNVLIDNLTYNYYGNDKSNRLFSVNDQGTIEGYVPATGNYTYDANANMTHDPSKLINVVYNHLNLPRQINFGPEDNIQYAYTATGTKLRKTVTTMKTTTGSVTDYCGNFIYSDNQIITIFAGDVRIVPVNVGNSTFWKYEYSMKDHLGNVRVVFAAHSHGQPELMQQTSYYPFGMTLQQQNFSSQNATENKYLYNSKELQDDQLAGNTLDWYDYGWRFYDPLTVRFTIVDRFAEKYTSLTPYHYGANNPIYFIDVNGDSLWVTHRTGFLGLGGKQTLLFENGNLYNQDGTAYTGKVKGYLSKAKGALDDINAVSSGQGLLRQLEGSDLNFTVQRGSNKFVPNSVARAGLARVSPAHAAAASSDGTIYWNPGAKSSGPNQLGNTARPNFLGLTHELGHASMAEQGMSDYSLFAPGHADPNLSRVTNDEFNAVHIENQVRSEYNIPLREFYTRDATGAGFMRFLTPATSTNAVTGYNYILNNPMQINYMGPNSGR